MKIGDEAGVKRCSSSAFIAFIQPYLENGRLSPEELRWVRSTQRRIHNRECAATSRERRRLKDKEIALELESLRRTIAELNREIEMLRDLNKVIEFGSC
jgi:hypothetical protein